MAKPLVTILTPSFNRAHTLPKVYQSLKEQTFKDFEWIIIDDGSTDNTKETVEDFIKDASLNIRFYTQENKHKFLTFFRGINLAEGKYFSPLDSDDTLPKNSLEILVNTWESLSPDQNIVFVSSLCQDENGKIIGDFFPQEPLICSIFEMRYKYKIKGDKWGMGKTEIYKKMNLDLEKLSGKGFIPEGVFQYQFDSLGFHYCINKVTRNYIRDENDDLSLANQFYDRKNAFGLSENYKTFLNSYSDKAYQYPIVIFKQTIGYLLSSFYLKYSFSHIISEIKKPTIKLFVFINYPLGYIYYLIKKLTK